MEGEEAIPDVERRIEKNEASEPSVPILSAQRDATEEVRRQQREGRLRPVALREGEHRVEIIFQGCECGLRGIAVAEPDVTAVIVS